MRTKRTHPGAGSFYPQAGTALALILCLTGEARADNTEPFFYSDDAAMTGGSVVAATQDSGAIWYNPAGLGGIKRGAIDLSGSAFGIRFRRVPNALRTRLPTTTQNVTLDSADIFSAPHAIALVRNLSESVTIGAGLYITARDIRNAESQVDVNDTSFVDPSELARYRQRLDLSIDLTRYHFGPAIGWQIAPGLRVGASLFGTYGKQSGFAQFVLAAEANNTAGQGTIAAIGQNRFSFSYFGTQPQVGVQWDPDPDWGVGILLRAPEFLLGVSPNGASIQSTAVAVPNQPAQVGFVLEKQAIDVPAFTVISPLRVVFGVVRRFGDRTWVNGEFDIQAPFTNVVFDQAAVFNARVGARFRVTEKFGIGFGAFSDRARETKLGVDFTDERVDTYGFAGGVELRTPLSLTGKNDPEALVLSTTLALKYAVGLGTVRAMDVDLVTGNTVPPREVDVVYHTILPYIGSGILF